MVNLIIQSENIKAQKYHQRIMAKLLTCILLIVALFFGTFLPLTINYVLLHSSQFTYHLSYNLGFKSICFNRNFFHILFKYIFLFTLNNQQRTRYWSFLVKFKLFKTRKRISITWVYIIVYSTFLIVLIVFVDSLQLEQ